MGSTVIPMFDISPLPLRFLLSICLIMLILVKLALITLPYCQSNEAHYSIDNDDDDDTDYDNSTNWNDNMDMTTYRVHLIIR